VQRRFTAPGCYCSSLEPLRVRRVLRISGMSARRWTEIVSAAMAAGAVAVLAASVRTESAGASRQTATRAARPAMSGATVRERPHGVVEDCSTRSSARFPGAFTNPRNLIVGPLASIGAGGTPSVVSNSTGTEVFQKFPLLVRNGHRVTVELSPSTRRGAGLAYGPLPEGETHLRDTHRVVTFIACRHRQRSGSTADGRPVTFWSGSVLARLPRCVRLLVWVDAARSPRRAVIRLGVPNCG
jgi:hypothetical protein